MIKNLIFDFGKVLVDYDYMLVLDLVFSTHEQSVDFYSLLMAEGWNKRLDREDKPFEAIIDDMAEAMPQYADEIREFGNRYTEFIIGEIDGMRSLLERLKQEGYRLFGLTNWCSKVHVTMKQYPIFELLEDRLVSSEEHLIKPERAIYERMCEKFALKPEECVFADDRMDNIEAARDYGMRGIVFRNARQYEADLRRILDIESRVERAVDNFMQGYGCCQSVVAAFGDMYGLDDNLAKRIGAGFGGGVGRMRMMCGAVSGIVTCVGLDCGQTDGADREGKSACYKVVQDLLAKSKEQNGSLICAEILGLKGVDKAKSSYVASARTAEYYKKRPCAAKVESAARIFADYLEDKLFAEECAADDSKTVYR